MPARELLSVPSTRALLLGGGALVAVAAVALAPAAAPAPVEVPPLAMEAREPAALPVREAALEDEVAEPEAVDPLASLQPMDEIEDPADFAFAVTLGGTTYIRLGSDADFAVDADQDNAVFFDDDGDAVAIADISASGLPEELERWKGRRVLVGGTCAATVIAFAEIARVSGDARLAYDGADADAERPTAWTVETAFSHGSTMIAAELDRRCDGSWARAADRPAVGHAIAVTDERLEGAARRAFLASGHAAAIEDEWREAKQEGDWRDQIALDTSIVEHSVTGARWAYVHARKYGRCGDHDVNVAALYQISEDGALTEIETGELSGHDIEELVDLNGDGWFERIVRGDYSTGQALLGPVGDTELAEIHVPFHGCPC